MLVEKNTVTPLIQICVFIDSVFKFLSFAWDKSSYWNIFRSGNVQDGERCMSECIYTVLMHTYIMYYITVK